MPDTTTQPADPETTDSPDTVVSYMPDYSPYDPWHNEVPF